MRKPVTVYLVDDHAVVREGYRHLLQKAGILVIAEAASGEEAYQNTERIAPDVIVLDISMPGIGGIETIQKIMLKAKKTKILAFSMHDDAVFSKRAMQAGACGYVTKSSAPDVLIEAVLAVVKGKKYISADIAEKVTLQTFAFADPSQHESQDLTQQLSDREFQVFRLLAQGQSLDEIASALCLDYKTIANTQTRLKQKLNLSNNAQLVLAAVKLKLIAV